MAKKSNEPQAVRPEIQDTPTMLRFDREDSVTIGKSSVIGSRPEQQDAIITDNDLAYLQFGRMIAILCDGMGGMKGGNIASQLCTAHLYSEFQTVPDNMNIREFFSRALDKADMEVNSLRTETGKPMHSGTTLVSAVIIEGRMYLANVGDSHGYLIRGGKISQITEEHNLMSLLLEEVAQGNITMEEARRNPKREALTSFIGMGGLRYKQITDPPLELRSGDYIILCSDGLYRTVSNEEIKQVVVDAGVDVQGAADALTELALSKRKPKQDNTSVVVLLYQ